MQYLDRPAVLENVLNDLFHIFRYENCQDLKSALDIILMAMDRHPGEKVKRLPKFWKPKLIFYCISGYSNLWIGQYVLHC